MKVLALDLSRHVGVAHDGPNDRPILSTKHLPVVEGDGMNGFDFGTSWIEYWHYLNDLITVIKPDLIGFEAPLMPRPRAPKPGLKAFVTPEVTVRFLFGLACITETLAGLRGIPCEERNVATVKKHFAGHGFADKEQLKARCRQLGWTFHNDNESDAAGLYALLKAEFEPSWVPNGTPLFGRPA